MRIIILSILIFITNNINAQLKSDFIYKCKTEKLIGKSECEMISLNSDSSFEHIFNINSDIVLLESGKYFIEGDTIVMIYNDIDFVSSISGRKGFNKYNLYFENSNEYPVKVDSVIVFENGNSSHYFINISKIEFSQGDSIHYYLYGNTYYAPLIFGNRTLRSLTIELPVEYLIIIDNNTLINRNLDKIYKTSPNK